MLPILLLIFLPTYGSAACRPGGQWSYWNYDYYSVPNPDFCGACDVTIFSRYCQSAPACPCTGPSTWTGSLFTNPCKPPRKPCCPGFQLITGDGWSQCGPQELPTIPKADENCDPTLDGLYSHWGPWLQPNSRTCGDDLAMNRTRTCLTEQFGCSCESRMIEYMPSMPALCANGTCDYYWKPTTANDGALICTRVDLINCTGLVTQWTEWTATDPAACGGGNCGGCGAPIQYTRICTPSLCNCTGSNTKTEPCNIPCKSPNKTTCCAGYNLESTDATTSASKRNVRASGPNGVPPPVRLVPPTVEVVAFHKRNEPAIRRLVPVGEATRTTVCGKKPCSFLKPACCDPYKLIKLTNGTFSCMNSEGLQPMTVSLFPGGKLQDSYQGGFIPRGPLQFGDSLTFFATQTADKTIWWTFNFVRSNWVLSFHFSVRVREGEVLLRGADGSYGSTAWNSDPEYYTPFPYPVGVVSKTVFTNTPSGIVIDINDLHRITFTHKGSNPTQDYYGVYVSNILGQISNITVNHGGNIYAMPISTEPLDI